jgi:hypothetical protein
MPPAASRRPGPSRNWRLGFIVKNSTGQKLAYVYFEDEPGRQSAAKLLTKDEARRIAVNFREDEVSNNYSLLVTLD